MAAGTITLTLPGSTEDLVGALEITWPATAALTANPGDLILRNRGNQTSYAASDGVITVQFASTLVGTTVTGSGTGIGSGSPGTPYDGPFCTIAPSAYDATDPNFHDLEIYGDVGWFRENNTGQYPVSIYSGDSTIYGHQVQDSAVSDNHLHNAHHARGHFSNGAAAITPIAGTMSLVWTAPNSADPFEFVTDDGTGDSSNIGASGDDGAYVLDYPSYSNNGNGYFSFPFIYTTAGIGGLLPACPWDGGSPSRNMISFTTVFPGSYSYVVNSTGGVLVAGTYSLRFCAYKSLTLKTTAGGVASTTTKTVETPLSTPQDIVIGSGTANSIALTLPPLPAHSGGWDGVRIYLGQKAGGLIGPNTTMNWFQLLTQGTHYTVAGNVYTITTIAVPAVTTASHGFCAWPTGTLLVKDPAARAHFLMKWAHVSASTEPTTGNYDLSAYHDGVAGALTPNMAKAAMKPAHIASSTAGQNPAWSTGKVLGQDGLGNFSYHSVADLLGGNNNAGVYVNEIISGVGTPAWLSLSAGQIPIGGGTFGVAADTIAQILGVSHVAVGTASSGGSGSTQMTPAFAYTSPGATAPAVVFVMPLDSPTSWPNTTYAPRVNSITTTGATAIFETAATFVNGSTYDYMFLAIWT